MAEAEHAEAQTAPAEQRPAGAIVETPAGAPARVPTRERLGRLDPRARRAAVMRLQRAYGNAAVARHLAGAPEAGAGVRTAAPRTLARAVTADPNSATIDVAQGGLDTDVKIDTLFTGSKFAAAITTPPGITMDASATIACGAGESTAGYELGLVQVETSEENHATYRGLTPADGSMYFDAGRRRKPAGSCLDVAAAGKFWTSEAGKEASAAVTCGKVTVPTFHDHPSDGWHIAKTNSLTKQQNYLSEMTIRMKFVTALMLRRPKGALDLLRWIRWELEWLAWFSTAADGTTKLSRSQTGGLWVKDGGPTPTELPKQFGGAVDTCLDIGGAAKSGDAWSTSSDSSAGPGDGQ